MSDDKRESAPGSLQAAHLSVVGPAELGMAMRLAVDDDCRIQPGAVAPLAWLHYPEAVIARNRGGFWMEWRLGEEVVWLRFEHRCDWFNRAAFEVAEVRWERDQDPPGPGALWLPSTPPGLRSPAIASTSSGPRAA